MLMISKLCLAINFEKIRHWKFFMLQSGSRNIIIYSIWLLYKAVISLTINSATMGCSAGKLDGRKIKDSPVFAVDENVKIQTVLKLNNSALPYTSKSQRRTSRSRNRKHDSRRNDQQVNVITNNKKNSSSSEIHRKPSRTERSTPSTKTTYDSKIIAKYDVKAVIGKGSFSRVLRVENRVSKQPYALKIIEAPGGREAFEAELSVLRRLNHPNVIKLIEVFESNHKVYMVMELATGGSLLDRLESKGYLPEDDSRDVIKMVLEGVRYLHVLGITHRDLKPDNLLYYHPGKESRILITDFSLASTRRAIGKSYMHTVCGTPQYIAPEIVTRRPYTCAVDMWAVGVITYIVICGIFPFDAEHDAQIFKLILRGRVQMTDPLWNGVSEESKSFISQLLNTDPVARLDASSALQHAWFTSGSLTYRPNKKRSTDGDQRSVRSVGSSKSGNSSSSSSRQSLRVSGRGRVQVHHLEALRSDPEVAAML